MKFFGNKADDYFDGTMKDYPWPVKLLYWICLIVVLVFSKIYWRWTYDGKMPYGEKGEVPGRVVVANHASMFDPAVLIIISALNGRRLRPLYKSEFENNSFVNGFFARVGAIPIKRGSADTKAIRRAVRALGRGEDICVFPEGTRVRDPQERHELHGGFALIAQMAKTSIVPVAIDGSHLISPTGKGFPRPAKVRIRYGEAVSFEDVEGQTRRQKCDAIEKAAMDKVYGLRASLLEEKTLDKKA